MTREEITTQLQDIKCHCQEMYDAEVKNGDPSNIIWGKDVEALDLAIKALEQQPCEHKPFTIDELKNEDMQKLLREYQNQKVLVAEHDCLPSVSIINPSEDCISRQDALKAIEEEKYDWGNTGVEAIDGCLETIGKLPSVTPQQTRWIPCSEKLPEDNVHVLCQFNLGGMGECYLAHGVFHVVGGLVMTCNEVIAWQPLPSSYQGEENG